MKGMRWRGIAAWWTLAGVLGLLHELDRATGSRVPSRVENERERLLPWHADEVERIELVRAGVRLVLTRPAGRWAVAGPAVAATVPHDLVDAFAGALAGAEVLETVPGRGPEHDAFGFERRHERIELTDRAGVRVGFDVGDPAPTGTATYVRDGAGRVLLIGRNPVDYRDLILDAAGVAGAGGGPATGH